MLMARPAYFDRLLKLLKRRGNTPAEAEDLIQEAYLKMHEYCAKGGQIHEPAAFMARTAVRLGLNARRDAHPELFAEQDVEQFTFVVDPNPTPDEVLVADQCLEQMRLVLETLTEKTRQIFLMNRLEGMAYPRIAQVLGITESAVEKHIAIALDRLSSFRQGK